MLGPIITEKLTNCSFVVAWEKSQINVNTGFNLSLVFLRI